MTTALFPRPPIAGRPPPTVHHVQVDAVRGTKLAVIEWPCHGAPMETCVFIHATGFHSRCWDSCIRRVPSSWHCLAIDVRGHGKSDKPEPHDSMYPWPDLAAEITAVLQHFTVRGALGIAHSMGGYLLLRAAITHQFFFRGLLLCDPTVFPEKQYGVSLPSHDGVLRRFNRFKSAQDMYSRLHGKGSFGPWLDECLADYCGYGLLSSDEMLETLESGTPELADHLYLACPPNMEAATFRGAYHSDRDRYAELKMKVIILRASRPLPNSSESERPNFLASPTDPDMARLFVPPAQDVHLDDGCTHFFPMQNPALVVNYMQQMHQSLPQAQRSLANSPPQSKL